VRAGPAAEAISAGVNGGWQPISICSGDQSHEPSSSRAQSMCRSGVPGPTKSVTGSASAELVVLNPSSSLATLLHKSAFSGTTSFAFCENQCPFRNPTETVSARIRFTTKQVSELLCQKRSGPTFTMAASNLIALAGAFAFPDCGFGSRFESGSDEAALATGASSRPWCPAQPLAHEDQASRPTRKVARRLRWGLRAISPMPQGISPHS
jgi:hypothetical protein